MRFYNQSHAFYCGVDLHARSMYLCRNRINPRVVKHQVSSYAKKHPHHRPVPAIGKSFLESVVMLV